MRGLGSKGKGKRRIVFNLMRQRNCDVICLPETNVTKTVSDVWMKQWGGEFVLCESTSHSAGQMILFRKGFSGNFKLACETEGMLIAVVEIIDKK